MSQKTINEEEDKVDFSTKKIMIIVTKPPYTSRTSCKAYEYADYILDHGGVPILFHFMDGIYNLHATQFAQNFPNQAERAKALKEKGAIIECCSRCLIARGFYDPKLSDLSQKKIIPSNLINGVTVKGVSRITNAAKLGYKIMLF
jgi:sulfur relay (sulfurtransferase) complex TusBCD TusD component (DsrE family)